MKGRDSAIRHWEKAQHLVEQCTKIHLPVTEAVYREAKQNNGRLQDQLDREFLAAEVEMEVCNGSLLAHVQGTAKFDSEVQKGLQCSISNQMQTLATLRSHHQTKVEELDRFSSGCFENIKEDQPTNLTPKRREIQVPSKASVEELCAPSAEMIIRKFKERIDRVAKENVATDRENFVTKPSHLIEAPPTRIPLARLN